jgi:hypothetical protein
MAASFMDIRTAFAILGLAEAATPLQVRTAYRDLVKVWHPDRFAHDPPLQAKAAEQLRQINAAFDLLQERQTSGPPPRPQAQARPAPPPPAPQSPSTAPVEPPPSSVRVYRYGRPYQMLLYIGVLTGATMIVSIFGTPWSYLPPDLPDLLDPASVTLDAARSAGGGLDRTYVEVPLASDRETAPGTSLGWYATTALGLANNVEGTWLLNGKRFTFHQGMIRATGDSAALGYYDPNTPQTLFYRKARNVHHAVVEVVFTPATMRWVVRDSGRRLVYEFVRAG